MNDQPITIRALSLHQPWASLIAWGFKRYETRHWTTAHRGLLAIHAAKHRDLDDEQDLLDDLDCRFGYHDLTPAAELPRGQVVAIVRLVGCHRMTPAVMDEQSRLEERLGHWALDRFAWEIGDVRRLSPPVDARGYQGLWDWQVPEHLRSVVKEMEPAT